MFEPRIWPVPTLNAENEAIPPYSVVAIGDGPDLTPGAMFRPDENTGAGTGDFAFHVRKPDAKSLEPGSYSQFMFTLRDTTDSESNGWATPTLPGWVAVDSAITERGAKVGPEAGNWQLVAKDGYYSVIDLKTVNDQKYAFVNIVGTGGGGGQRFWFEVTTAKSGDGPLEGNVATIRDRFGLIVRTGVFLFDPAGLFGSLPVGTHGYCDADGDYYWITAAGCEIEGLLEEE